LYIALLAATLFLLHPIQTSAVNYITQRMAIMASMFSFAGLIFYVKGVTNSGKRSASPLLLFGAVFRAGNLLERERGNGSSYASGL